jgi:predicted DNA-binding transcriptional regulator AlpA
MPKDKLLTVAEAAAELNFGKSTLRDGKCGLDQIPRVRVGRRLMFSEAAIQAWIARKAREAEQLNQKQKQEQVAGTRRRQWLRLAIARQESIRRNNKRRNNGNGNDQ